MSKDFFVAPDCVVDMREIVAIFTADGDKARIVFLRGISVSVHIHESNILEVYKEWAKGSP